MRKNKKMKLSKFKVAKINNLEVKGGVDSNACASAECLPTDSNIDTHCRTTGVTRNSNSL